MENALASLLRNTWLLEKWKGLSRTDECLLAPGDGAYLILQLLKDVATHYVKMGVEENLREFQREFQVLKTEAHHKG